MHVYIMSYICMCLGVPDQMLIKTELKSRVSCFPMPPVEMAVSRSVTIAPVVSEYVCERDRAFGWYTYVRKPCYTQGTAHTESEGNEDI